MKARIIAYYLPQFHPVDVNDKFWGKGFTEWVNVAKAKPLFKGHEQPRIPADLGYYDLRLNTVALEQAKLAKEAGIEGFCYWHYWFGNGEEVLEMPLDRMVKEKEPDFPFCIGWANHDWSTKTWKNEKKYSEDTSIFKQKYLGPIDNEKHFYRLLDAFKDKRYLKVDGRLIFVIFDYEYFENLNEFMQQWNQLAERNNIPSFYFIAMTGLLNGNDYNNTIKNIDNKAENNVKEVLSSGLDGVITVSQKYAEYKTIGNTRKIWNVVKRRYFNHLAVEKYDYKKIIKNFYAPINYLDRVYPQLIAGWDRTPRSGRNATIYYNSNPNTFEYVCNKAVELVANREYDQRLIFLNSWNEWGEGAYMEPDQRFGKAFIETLRKVVDDDNKNE